MSDCLINIFLLFLFYDTMLTFSKLFAEFNYAKNKIIFFPDYKPYVCQISFKSVRQFLRENNKHCIQIFTFIIHVLVGSQCGSQCCIITFSLRVFVKTHFNLITTLALFDSHIIWYLPETQNNLYSLSELISLQTVPGVCLRKATMMTTKDYVRGFWWILYSTHCNYFPLS